MTTIHLGDCLNGCATCAYNYHNGQLNNNTCDTCNVDLELDRLYRYESNQRDSVWA